MSRDLSPRQRDVCALVAAGKRNKEIAHVLGIEEGTVKIHLGSCFMRAGVGNRVELANWWNARQDAAE